MSYQIIKEWMCPKALEKNLHKIEGGIEAPFRNDSDSYFFFFAVFLTVFFAVFFAVRFMQAIRTSFFDLTSK
ncbi:MAG: hypothetical protein ABIK22_01675 [candidate division WOR-3 bacterium]